MSTRIKIAADIGAAANEGVIVNSNPAAPANQAWLDAFEAMMLAAGFTRTADTGQFGAAGTMSNANDVGYRVYALSDEHSATSPLIVKAFFAGRPRGVASGIYYRMRCRRIQVGLATDGAGNFVGNTCVAFDLTQATMFSSISWRGNLKTYAWRKDYTTFCCMQASSAGYSSSDAGGNYSANTAEFCFAVSRLRDYQGNIDTSGFMVYGCIPAIINSTAGYCYQSWGYAQAFRLTAAAVLDIGASCSMLMGPSANYKLDAGSKPILQTALYGRTVDDFQYSIGGIYLYQDLATLTLNGLIDTTGPDGSLQMAVVGHLWSPYDPMQAAAVLRSQAAASQTANNVTTYLGNQPYNTNCGVVLDWS